MSTEQRKSDDWHRWESRGGALDEQSAVDMLKTALEDGCRISGLKRNRVAALSSYYGDRLRRRPSRFTVWLEEPSHD